MTKNERLTEISTEAFVELCRIADEHKARYKPIYGQEANEKWWLVLYPAVHIPMNKEFYVGACSGLTFPTCDISMLPINMGSKFVFPSREVVVAFGLETQELWKTFLYPELTLLMTRTK